MSDESRAVGATTPKQCLKMFAAVYGCLSVALAHGADLTLSKDTATIGESVTIAPGTYRISGGDDRAAVEIVGDGISVDFQGAELVGSDDDAPPDTYTGRGIVVHGRNVTLRNAKIRGYKVGIYAEDCPGLTITRCDVSRNYRQHLKSSIEREDETDWLFGHENDNNQWLRFGAGVYLLRCPKATVAGCRARNGQNGLCVSRCDDSAIYDNDMSFMSGWGLAMWRTSRCDVSNNRFDWCIRGYSHGVYSRGQDSTGILVYEQCNDNVFAFNSATHGGDGFFLYAGHETLQRTGTGGCNHNVLYRNDFSHAAANGIESTFSDGNIFADNILDECEHGVWAGYSCNTIIARNHIGDCTNGISIEHGRENVIAENTFTKCGLGVNLWWDDDKDLLASKYGEAHEKCPSTHNRVVGDRFERVRTAVRLGEDTNSTVRWNKIESAETALHITGNAEGTRFSENAIGSAGIRDEAHGERTLSPNDSADGYEQPEALARLADRLPPKTRGKQDAYLPKNFVRGRRYIVIDEWGPYDFSDVRVFPAKFAGGERAMLQVLGPAGKFKVTKATGDVSVSPMQGDIPARLTVTPAKDGLHAYRLDIEAGEKTITATGTLMKADWTVKFFRWHPSADPREDQKTWDELTAGEPLEERHVSSIDFVWAGGAPGGTVPRDYFGTVATTTLNLPAGNWGVRTVSDDGVRVWIDDRRIIDDWTWHPPKEDTAKIELSEGEHSIRIEHFEIDGYAQLQFRMAPE